MEPTAEKQHAHELIDRLKPEEISIAVRFLEFMMLDPVSRSIASASVEDEEITPETAAELDRARASIERGEGISHEEIMREFGLKPRS